MAVHSEQPIQPDRRREIYITSNSQVLLDGLKESNPIHLSARSNANPIEFTIMPLPGQIGRMSDRTMLYCLLILEPGESLARTAVAYTELLVEAQKKGAHIRSAGLKGNRSVLAAETIEDSVDFLVGDLRRTLD